MAKQPQWQTDSSACILPGAEGPLRVQGVDTVRSGALQVQTRGKKPLRLLIVASSHFFQNVLYQGKAPRTGIPLHFSFNSARRRDMLRRNIAGSAIVHCTILWHSIPICSNS